MSYFIIALVIVLVVRYFFSFNKYKEENGLTTQAETYESVKWDEFVCKSSSRLSNADKNGTFLEELTIVLMETRTYRDRLANPKLKQKANKVIENLEKEYSKRTGKCM